MSADRPDARRPAGRKLAEWVSLGLSAAVVLGVAAYLAYDAVRESPPFVPVAVRVLADQAQERGGRYVVPVEVRNDGRQTLKELKLQVSYRAPDGAPQTGDVLVTYLGERASQRVYLYFDRHPSGLRVEVRPFSYQAE